MIIKRFHEGEVMGEHLGEPGVQRPITAEVRMNARNAEEAVERFYSNRISDYFETIEVDNTKLLPYMRNGILLSHTQGNRVVREYELIDAYKVTLPSDEDITRISREWNILVPPTIMVKEGGRYGILFYNREDNRITNKVPFTNMFSERINVRLDSGEPNKLCLGNSLEGYANGNITASGSYRLNALFGQVLKSYPNADLSLTCGLNWNAVVRLMRSIKQKTKIDEFTQMEENILNKLEELDYEIGRLDGSGYSGRLKPYYRTLAVWETFTDFLEEEDVIRFAVTCFGDYSRDSSARERMLEVFDSIR